jgi:hypothetical protein
MGKIKSIDYLKVKDYDSLLTLNDYKNLSDSYVNKSKNYARILLDDKLVEITNNIVVLPGREFIPQKIFGKFASGNEDLRSHYISHFGIGSGGSNNIGGLITLNGPDSCDKDLLDPIPIDPGNLTFLTSPNGIENVVKSIESDGFFDFAENPDPLLQCPGENYYTIVKASCVITNDEPTNLSVGNSIKVDEAALYAVHGSSTKMFARITFPPHFIGVDTIFTIEWFIVS